MTADIWMPNLRVKFHDWRAKGVISGYLDINYIVASFIGGARWTFEGALEVRQVISVAHRVGEDV